jgi:hypothetical protein
MLSNNSKKDFVCSSELPTPMTAPRIRSRSGMRHLAQTRNDGLIFIGDTSGTCSRCRVVICPSGGLLRGVSSPVCKNISLHPSGKSSLQIRAIPSHTEGRFAIVTDVGHGMRWTRQRFARDGIAGRVERLVSDHRRADERRLQRTAKSCGPDAPTLASSSRSLSRPDRA